MSFVQRDFNAEVLTVEPSIVCGLPSAHDGLSHCSKYAHIIKSHLALIVGIISENYLESPVAMPVYNTVDWEIFARCFFVCLLLACSLLAM